LKIRLPLAYAFNGVSVEFQEFEFDAIDSSEPEEEKAALDSAASLKRARKPFAGERTAVLVNGVEIGADRFSGIAGNGYIGAPGDVEALSLIWRVTRLWSERWGGKPAKPPPH